MDPDTGETLYSAKFSHVFYEPPYDVVLTVTDTDGDTDTETVTTVLSG